MYVNLHQQGLGGFSYNWYWSSSAVENFSQGAGVVAWVKGFYYGGQNIGNRDTGIYFVRDF